MATARYRTVWDPRYGRYTRKRIGGRTRGVSGIASASLSGLGAFGTGKSLKSMLGGVKGVLITGAIAAGGALTTDALFEKIGANWGIVGWQRDLAKMGTGIALGILIAKILKKPRLAAAFAIGPIVAGAMRIFADVLGPTSGLGETVVEKANRYTSQYAPFYGTQQAPALPMGSVDSYGPANQMTSPPARIPEDQVAAQTIYM